MSQFNMRYILKHKDLDVALIDINDKCNIVNIEINETNRAHLPLGCELNNTKFKEWWSDRAIPSTRDNCALSLRAIQSDSTKQLMVQGLARSLNDCYWICPLNEKLTWNQISPYRGNFRDLFGISAFYKNAIEIGEFTWSDLNNAKAQQVTSGGNLRKRWVKSSDGEIKLIKGNNLKYGYHQSISEFFATHLHSKQGTTVPFVSYEKNREIYGDLDCVCNNFCSENIEFISAWEVLQTVKINKSDSYYSAFKNICINRFGFSEAYFDYYMSYLFCTDFILTNEDRHLNNIGVIRNPDTLKYYGFSPIYDFGNSMCYRGNIANIYQVETSSFRKWEIDLLRYVTDSNCVNLNKLPSANDIRNYYANNMLLYDNYIESIIRVYTSKVNCIYELQSGKPVWNYRTLKYRGNSI